MKRSVTTAIQLRFLVCAEIASNLRSVEEHRNYLMTRRLCHGEETMRQSFCCEDLFS